MTLRLAASNPDAGTTPSGPRILAPGAPPSPGPVPNDLARHLQFGEALVWWNEKDRVVVGPVLLVLLAAISILGFVSLFVPEFWMQPWKELAKPIGVLLSPAAFVLLRERANRRAVLVTDGAVVSVDLSGRADRVGLHAIEAVRRDLLRGGLVLHGRNVRVRLPPTLLDDAHRAIASQRGRTIRGATRVDDPTGWLP